MAQARRERSTWRVDGEALLRDVTGTEAVVQRARGAGDGDLNALTVQIDHSIHFWKRQRHTGLFQHLIKPLVYFGYG